MVYEVGGKTRLQSRSAASLESSLLTKISVSLSAIDHGDTIYLSFFLEKEKREKRGEE